MTLKIEADANLKEAIIQKVAADTQRKEAEHQRTLAETQRTRAEEQTVVAGQQRARAEEQTQVTEQQKLIADRQRQRAETESAEALRQKTQAESARSLEAEARLESEREKALAVQQKERADNLRGQAETSEAEARRLRMLAVARALALQTTRMTSSDQRELSALLALQAYRLHEKNGGVPEDSQIFEALRSSLTRLDPKIVAVLETHPDAVHAVRSAPGANLVAAGGDDGDVWVSDLSAPSTPGHKIGSTGSEIRAVEWVDGGKQIAVGTLDGHVRLFNPSTAGPATALSGPGPGVTSMAANAAGNLLAVATANGDLTLRSLTGGAAPRGLKNPTGKPLASLVFLSDGRLVGATRGGGNFVWTPDRPDDVPGKVFGDRPIRSLAASEGRLAAGTDQGAILILAKGVEGTATELTGHTSAVTSLRFSPDGKRLATASLDSTIRLWDVEHPEREPIVLTGHNGWIWAVDFTSRGQRLISGGADRTVRSWPTQIEPLAAGICQRVKRSLTAQEWREYTTGDIPLEQACSAAAPARTAAAPRAGAVR